MNPVSWFLICARTAPDHRRDLKIKLKSAKYNELIQKLRKYQKKKYDRNIAEINSKLELINNAESKYEGDRGSEGDY